jgi:hypothetical protein
MDDAKPFRRARSALQRLARAAVITLLAGGCHTPYLGTTATSYLKNVRESKDPNIRYYAYAKLASQNCYDNEEQRMVAVGVLGKNLVSDVEPVATRAVICRTLGELGKVEARPALEHAASDPDDVVRAEAYRALGKVGRPEDATFLAQRMITDTQSDCRIAAIDGLAEIKSHDTRIFVMLVQGMEHDDPAIRLSSVHALRQLTGKDLGVDAAPWRDYVEKEIKDERAAEEAPAKKEARPATDKRSKKSSAKAPEGGGPRDVPEAQAAQRTTGPNVSQH